MEPSDVEARVEAIVGGRELSYAYDVYGSGRVELAIRWDRDRQAFVERRTDKDVGGQVWTEERTITRADAARHVDESVRT